MIIQNFDNLATTAARRKILHILESGLAAISTKNVVQRLVSYDEKKSTLRIDSKTFDLRKFKRVLVIGFGKVALGAVRELHSIFGTTITCGFVLDLEKGNVGKNIVCRVGTHPLPTTVNVEATAELLSLISDVSADDLIISVVSGGGSSLLCYPHEMSCGREVEIIRTLTSQGATITELNTVRKHISKVKGGQLAKLCYPATMVNLIFSDVPGDDISMVASGPTVFDSTTIRDASNILQKYQILELCNMPACSLIETPKDGKYFERVTNILAVSSKDARVAMERKADDLGLKPRIWQEAFSGEARVVGPEITAATLPGECLIATGETTVKITGSGMGGRNQELALAALAVLAPGQVVASLASDGYDNTPAAGAIVDHSVLQVAHSRQLDPEFYLSENNSYQFFQEVGAQVLTGLTGSNVADFVISLRE